MHKVSDCTVGGCRFCLRVRGPPKTGRGQAPTYTDSISFGTYSDRRENSNRLEQTYLHCPFQISLFSSSVSYTLFSCLTVSVPHSYSHLFEDLFLMSFSLTIFFHSFQQPSSLVFAWDPTSPVDLPSSRFLSNAPFSHRPQGVPSPSGPVSRPSTLLPPLRRLPYVSLRFFRFLPFRPTFLFVLSSHRKK